MWSYEKYFANIFTCSVFWLLKLHAICDVTLLQHPYKMAMATDIGWRHYNSYK